MGLRELSRGWSETIDREVTELHDNGFPAVLVRLLMIEIDELDELIVDAWRCQAPRALVDDFERRES